MNVTVGQAADAIGKTEDAKGHDQDMMGRLGKHLSAQGPDLPAAQAASQIPSTSAASQQQPPLNSSKQVSALSPMTTPGGLNDTCKVRHEGVDLFEGEKSVDAQAAHTGMTTPGGSLVSILQGRKRKAPDTAGDFSPGVDFCCSLNNHISDVQLYFDSAHISPVFATCPCSVLLKACTCQKGNQLTPVMPHWQV